MELVKVEEAMVITFYPPLFEVELSAVPESFIFYLLTPSGVSLLWLNCLLLEL